MASELQHIDDFFRKKNNEASAAGTNAGQHWQQMKEMMSKSPVLPDKTTALPLQPFMKYAAILLVAGFLVFIVVTKPRTDQQAITHTDKSLIHEPVSHTSAKDAANSIDKLTSAGTPSSYFISPDKTPKPQKILSAKNDNLPVTKNIDTPVVYQPANALTQPDNLTAFTGFYNDLKKPAQEFTIDTRRDTTVYAKEGTSLFIPASSFRSATGLAVTGIVKVYIKEFYSLGDIISNKLTTVSNGKPLVTGGMVHIKATADKEDVTIKPGATLGLKMPTREFDSQMQLFTGAGEPGNGNMIKRYATFANRSSAFPVNDTAATTIDTEKEVLDEAFAFSTGGINWIAAGQQQFFLKEIRKDITILNLTDNPYEISSYKKNTKTQAKFTIPYNSDLSKEQIKAELEKKYSRYYDKIKVKQEWKPLLKKNRTSNAVAHTWYETHVVGDSITIPLSIARRMKLVTVEDSLRYEEKWRKQYEEAVKRKQAYAEFMQVRESYDFRISNLGWINCDRFYNYPSSGMAEFVLNTGSSFEGTLIQAILILERENAALPGYWNNGKLSFTNLPAGEKVNVVCVGAKEGKVFSAIQQFTVRKNEISTLLFKETTPEAFKNELARFGNVTKAR